MNSFNQEKNKAPKKRSIKNEASERIYGITRPGKYYFPGKISSGCFDGNGFFLDDNKREREIRKEDLYDYSVEREYDPNGMYTGRPEDEFDVPVQDADDL